MSKLMQKYFYKQTDVWTIGCYCLHVFKRAELIAFKNVKIRELLSYRIPVGASAIQSKHYANSANLIFHLINS